MQERPEFRALDPEDVRAFLARNHVGRLVFTADGEVDVRPLHYAYSGGSLYGRTAPGARFLHLAEKGERVTFEVDEAASAFHWTSAIVRGRFGIVPSGSEEWEKAVTLIRRVVKDAFREGDPVPEREVVFRITVEEATGRAAR